MWGYFIGREYAHRRYGPNRHSLGSWWTPANPAPVFTNSWYALNEAIIREPDNNPQKVHIPSGFIHDIIDNNVYNAEHSLGEAFETRLDSIYGYTISTIYGQMNTSTTTSTQLIEKLRSLLPNGQANSLQNYDSLKTVYGY